MNIREARKEQEKEKKQEETRKFLKKQEQEKEKKQFLHDLKIAIKNDLKSVIEMKYQENGTDAKYFFYDINNRESIFTNILKDYKNKGLTEYEIIDILEENYNKILNNIDIKYKKHFENIKRIEEEKQKQKIQKVLEEEKAKREQEQKEIEKNRKHITIIQSIFGIFKWSFILIFGIIYLIFKFISELSKKY